MNVSIFQGISQDQVEEMLQCFRPTRAHFAAGETVTTLGSSIERVGILLSGEAHLAWIDFDGRHSILEQFREGDLFGEVFSLPVTGLAYFIEADAPCDVMFIRYENIVKRCPKACQHHSILVNNLFQMTARKAQSLATHINILSQRSIRQKLLTYLEILSYRTGSRRVTLPMTLSALADYICVDRSAMMRELKKLREEGALTIRGRSAELHFLS